jgi:hypothetical protein
MSWRFDISVLTNQTINAETAEAAENALGENSLILCALCDLCVQPSWLRANNEVTNDTKTPLDFVLFVSSW